MPQGWGFLRNYCTYAAGCSDAPELFHLGVGITILASAVSHKIRAQWLAGRPLVPNFYTLLTGPSRAARKTGSMDAGIDVLVGADPTLVMPVPGSYEELIAQIRSKPEGLLTYREFGAFLKTTQRGYGEPIRATLMDLYDWPPDRAFTRNLRKGKTVIEPPICLSMLSAVSTDLLFAYTELADWVGGFFGRMLLLYGERETFKMPQSWPPYRDYLVGGLANYVQAAFPACGGFHPDAWTQFENWSRWRDNQTASLPPRVQNFASAVTTLAAKIALVYAADASEFNAGVGWMVSPESLHRAILFCETVYLPSVATLGEQIALGVWERDRKKILNIIESTRDMGIARRDLLRKAIVSTQLLDDVIGTLREEGTVDQGNDARGIVYKRRYNRDGAPIIPFMSPEQKQAMANAYADRTASHL